MPNVESKVPENCRWSAKFLDSGSNCCYTSTDLLPMAGIVMANLNAATKLPHPSLSDQTLFSARVFSAAIAALFVIKNGTFQRATKDPNLAA